MRCHYTPTEMAKVNKAGNIKCRQKCSSCDTYVSDGNVKWYKRFGERLIKKVKRYFPYNPASLLLGIYPRKMKILV